MSENVSRLLNKIANQELVLPEFQREFTWNLDQSKLLIDSLMEEYPTGSLLLWQTGNPPALKNQPTQSNGRVEVLLDGQQRLTVLYLLVKDDLPPYYSTLENDPRNLHYNLYTAELKYYKKMEMENDPRWVSVVSCFDSMREPAPMEIAQAISDDQDEVIELYEVLNENLLSLKSILEEEFPIMYVDDDSNLSQALTVFDRVNSQGTPLSDADIALAHMVSSWPNTRREFKRKLRELEGEGFEFDLTFLARCMNAVINGRAEFEHLHSLSADTLKEGWDELTSILDYLVNVLRDHAYVYSTGDLNSPYVLVPVISYLSNGVGEFRSEHERNRALYWMYGALLLRRYSGSVDTTLSQDLNALEESRPLHALIATLKEEEGDPKVDPENLDLRWVGHPLYNMMCVVIRSRGGVDWRNGLDLSEPYGSSYTIERHHIFPRARLSEIGYDTGDNHYDKKRVNEIANRVPMTKSGNLNIFDEDPASYLPTVVENYEGVLDAHMVPTDRRLWKLENYEEFLEARRRLVADGINEYLDRLFESEP